MRERAARAEEGGEPKEATVLRPDDGIDQTAAEEGWDGSVAGEDEDGDATARSEAIKAAKPKPSYEANPHWDSHKKQWKEGQEEVGMQREAANQKAKRAAADRTTQNAEQKRKRDEEARDTAPTAVA